MARSRVSLKVIPKAAEATLISPPAQPRLGVNIDHIATLRQLRGTPYPSLVEAANISIKAGAEQITIHLREDRRHIQDWDVLDIKKALQGSGTLLNLEIAATDAMVKFAIKVKPDWVCLVPEKRTEVTTEGGLELKKGFARVKKATHALQKVGIKVSLFIEPSIQAVRASRDAGATGIELHTGRFCLATQGTRKKKASRASAKKELARIAAAGFEAEKLGLRVHAGHGFDFENVRPVAELVRKSGAPLIEEFNIGHAIVCRAALVGLERSVREMASAIHAP